MIDLNTNKITLKIKDNKIEAEQVDFYSENAFNKLLKKRKMYELGIKILVENNEIYFVSINKKSIKTNLEKYSKKLKRKSQKKSLKYLSNKKEIKDKEREEAQTIINLEIVEDIKRTNEINKDILNKLDEALKDDF